MMETETTAVDEPSTSSAQSAKKLTRERLREQIAALAASHPIKFPTLNSTTPVISLESPHAHQTPKRQSKLDSWFNEKVAHRKHKDEDMYRTVHMDVVLCDSQSLSNLPDVDSQSTTNNVKGMRKMNVLVTERKEEELDKPHPNGIRKRVALKNQLLASIRAQRGVRQEERKRTYQAVVGANEDSDVEESEEEENSDSEEDAQEKKDQEEQMASDDDERASTSPIDDATTVEPKLTESSVVHDTHAKSVFGASAPPPTPSACLSLGAFASATPPSLCIETSANPFMCMSQTSTNLIHAAESGESLSLDELLDGQSEIHSEKNTKDAHREDGTGDEKSIVNENSDDATKKSEELHINSTENDYSNDGTAADESDCDDEMAAPVNFSDDEVAVVNALQEGTLKQWKKRRRNKFVEEEAELSGSDASSDEEEGDADDQYEQEAGDLDELPDDEELERQVADAHHKLMVKDDQAALRQLKEQYLPGGEMYSEQQRTLAWRFTNQDESDDEKMEDILARQQSQSDDELERKEKEEEEQRLMEIRKRAQERKKDDKSEDMFSLLPTCSYTMTAHISYQRRTTSIDSRQSVTEESTGVRSTFGVFQSISTADDSQANMAWPQTGRQGSFLNRNDDDVDGLLRAGTTRTIDTGKALYTVNRVDTDSRSRDTATTAPKVKRKKVTIVRNDENSSSIFDRF